MQPNILKRKWPRRGRLQSRGFSDGLLLLVSCGTMGGLTMLPPVNHNRSEEVDAILIKADFGRAWGKVTADERKQLQRRS